MIVPYPHLDTAEFVSPGHPDRLADAIADRLVEFAQSQGPPDRLSRSLVGVEVAVHDHTVFIDGRMALDGQRGPVPFETIARDVYTRAGYGREWGPDPASLEVITRVCVEPLTTEEADIRPFSDDQNIVHGYAIHRPETNGLPAAHWLAHHLGHAVRDFRSAHPTRYGPDFKVCVAVEDDGRRLHWRRLVLSLQHAAVLDMESQHRDLLPVVQAALVRAEAAGVDGAATSFQPAHLHLNGAGDFIIGGPRGDNGLSGKKLVVDHYGPSIPIGGGALCGKDAWKVDRCGPLRARQWARHLIAQGCHAAFTTLGWGPGDAAPGVREAVVLQAPGGKWSRLTAETGVPAASFAIESMVAALALTRQRWASVLRTGTFVEGTHPWEAPASGPAPRPPH